MRNTKIDLAILIVVLLIAYIQPTPVVMFFNTLVGRFLLLAGIVGLASVDTLWGLLGIIVLISMRENRVVEGFATNTTYVADWRTNHCDASFNIYTDISNVSTKKAFGQYDKLGFLGDFPYFKFTDGKSDAELCNPCDPTCKDFTFNAVPTRKPIVDREEAVRAKPSNSLVLDDIKITSNWKVKKPGAKS